MGSGSDMVLHAPLELTVDTLAKRIPDHLTSIQAELAAILTAATELANRQGRCPTSIVTDSQMALRLLSAPKCSSRLALRCHQEFQKIMLTSSLTLRYVKAHSGHPFNELADWLA